MEGATNSGAHIRSWLIGAVLIVSGCATPPPPDPPPPEVVVKYCIAELPAWVFERLPVPGLTEVKEIGGQNQHLVIIFKKQEFLLESGNQRLIKIRELLHDAIERCKQSAA